MTDNTDAPTEDTGASAAARRRAAKKAPTRAEAAVAEAPAPVAPPAAPLEPGKPLVLSRAFVATFAVHNPVGLTDVRTPANGVTSMASYLPLVQPASNAYGTLPHQQHYVTAECDAEESMVPAGCRTPVSRTLWRRGWRVRADFYTAAMGKADPASQAAEVARGPELPAGVTEPPTTMTTETASPIVRG